MIRITLRRQVRERDGFACAYCGVSEEQVGSELTIDHFQPRIAGGSDDLHNLLYCCYACNSFKGDWWNPDGQERILHPIRESIHEHLREEPDGTLRPLTPTGSFHCERLQLNRAPLVLNRRVRRRDRSAESERQQLLQELAQTQEHLATLLLRFGIKPESEPPPPSGVQ